MHVRQSQRISLGKRTMIVLVKSRDSVISILKIISISILIPFFPIISFQFLISISQKIPIFILIPFFDCNSYFNS